MKNNKGVTLVSLISSIVVLLILAATTISASVNVYNQMKFEGAKAEIEQMQKQVDEIAVDYQTFLKEDYEHNDYSDYFDARYNITENSEKFINKLLSAHKTDASELLNSPIGDSLDDTSKMTFYFGEDDLVKYFGLKGISPVVVDFSTRTIFSVNGIEDPIDDTKIYYTPVQWNSDKVIQKQPVSSTLVTVTGTKVSNSGNFYDISLTFNTKLKNDIIEVYISEATTSLFKKVDSFRDISNDVTVIRVTVPIVDSSKSYVFKLIDSAKNSYTSEATSVAAS